MDIRVKARLLKVYLYLYFSLYRLKRCRTIFTHSTDLERYFLHFLASRKKGIIAVEIGSYIGASSTFIAAGLNGKSKLFCIDTWSNDAMTEGHKDTYDEFMKNTSSFKDNIIALRG